MSETAPPAITLSTAVGLRPPLHHVSPRAIRYWAVRALVGWLIALAVVVAFGLFNHLFRDHTVGIGAVIAVLVVVATAHLLVMPAWRYRVHRWEATDEAVYTQVGWFNQERRIAPASRIQTIDTELGPIERLFGLANVTVTTASAAGPVKISGLRREDAEQLVDRLTATVYTVPGDAT
jgi:membrane protein YdbS with pleckstrin-like domain